MLVDHDNVPFGRVALREILDGWLSAIDDLLLQPSIVTMRVRAYGGWFLEDSVTEGRFHAAEFYQRTCPAAFFHGQHLCRVSFEFADHLLSTQGYERIPITYTVASRPFAQYLKLRTDGEACKEPDCRLQEVRRWVTTRRGCPRAQCPMDFADCFERREQKRQEVLHGAPWNDGRAREQPRLVALGNR